MVPWAVLGVTRYWCTNVECQRSDVLTQACYTLSARLSSDSKRTYCLTCIFCLHSSSLYSIAMSRENPSKVHNVELLLGAHVRVWLSATLVALGGSSAAHVSILQWQKATFLPSQYMGTYTVFFKERYLFEKHSHFLSPLFLPVNYFGTWCHCFSKR